MSFTQFIEVSDADEDALAEHITGWHREQFGTAPGYLGARMLADADHPGRHIIEVDFTSEDEARQNNDRSATVQWAETLHRLGTVTADAYRNCREVVATRDIT